MVDVLWRRGESDAAIRLEVLWNDLAATHTFSLLCGYAIGNFYKETSKLEEVCHQHTHVLGAQRHPDRRRAPHPRARVALAKARHSRKSQLSSCD